MKKIVVGGSYQDYIRWRNEHRLSPMEAFYVGNEPERLMGLELKEEQIVRLGYMSKAMEDLLRTRIR